MPPTESHFKTVDNSYIEQRSEHFGVMDIGDFTTMQTDGDSVCDSACSNGSLESSSADIADTVKVFELINLKGLLRISPQHHLNCLNLLAYVNQVQIAGQRFPTVSTLFKTTYSVFQHKQNGGEATAWAS